MIHKPIQIFSLSLSFPHKTCFEDFTTQITYGSRIAIIGRNGSGKTTLLKILQGQVETTHGKLTVPDDVTVGYVPQIIEEFDHLSGGERLNAEVTRALALNPNVLLLDEPTNHLDQRNRTSLMRMLRNYPGTLIVISHDPELLRSCIDTLWHIDNGKVHIFSGNYDDYMHETQNRRQIIERELSRLDRQKKDMHHDLMKEQARAKKSNLRGEKSIRERKWPTIVSDEKARRAVETSGNKKKAIREHKEELLNQFAGLRLPEIIIPKFSLTAADIGMRTLVAITSGTVSYPDQPFTLRNINLSLTSQDRVAILGDNGSGKTTLIKAILGHPEILITGEWQVPKLEDIGYLDQNYATLSPEHSVLESITRLVPSWSHAEVRRHLNDFLFRKNEEVNALVSQLSGGEKAKLSLAQIAAKTPKLLVLDELTNNLDLETREHVISVLKSYPGAVLIISHDEDFLQDIGVKYRYHVENGVVKLV